MDDRHCRFFHRQLTRHARLYSEMLTTGTLLHGDAARHLAFDAAEHPVALQLGGSEPDELARAAKLGASYGYDEINLNCGCPSERVQRGRLVRANGRAVFGGRLHQGDAGCSSNPYNGQHRSASIAVRLRICARFVGALHATAAACSSCTHEARG